MWLPDAFRRRGRRDAPLHVSGDDTPRRRGKSSPAGGARRRL